MSLPRRCVIDTSAAEDLHAGKLLRPFLAVTHALIPDLLEHEFGQARWAQIHAWGVETAELSGVELKEVIKLNRERPALSTYDHAVILVARRESVPMLTSNFSHVPQQARAYGVASFGVLRVVEELVRLSIVDPPAGVHGIQAMIDAGSYLPEDHCRRMIARLTDRDT
jgi:hypothetical protein